MADGLAKDIIHVISSLFSHGSFQLFNACTVSVLYQKFFCITLQEKLIIVH